MLRTLVAQGVVQTFVVNVAKGSCDKQLLLHTWSRRGRGGPLTSSVGLSNYMRCRPLAGLWPLHAAATRTSADHLLPRKKLTFAA